MYLEALMGAIYLDLGYEKVKEVALNIIVPYIEDKSKVFLVIIKVLFKKQYKLIKIYGICFT